jgi:iron-sulfur cluster assembly protein
LKTRFGSVRAGRLRVIYGASQLNFDEVQRSMAILLTESAANRVRTHLAQRGIGVGLRVGIKKTGCSGFAYVVNYADQINPEDAVFEARGVKVVVDPLSLPLIDGTVVDFVKQGLNEAFKFQNPKAKGECGCGESFNV